jgi:hypothetical protein
LKQRTADVAGTLSEEGSVDGDDLRHICDRIFRETRGVRGKQHVPGCVELKVDLYYDNRDDNTKVPTLWNGEYTLVQKDTAGAAQA